MTKVYTGGLYHYEVIGEREAEAAAELENSLDFLSRAYPNGGEAYLIEQNGVREFVRSKYGVEIHPVVG